MNNTKTFDEFLNKAVLKIHEFDGKNKPKNVIDKIAYIKNLIFYNINKKSRQPSYHYDQINKYIYDELFLSEYKWALTPKQIQAIKEAWSITFVKDKIWDVRFQYANDKHIYETVYKNCKEIFESENNKVQLSP